MQEEPIIWETQPAQRGVVIRNALATMQVKKLRECSVHKPTQKCTQLNGIDPVHECGVKVCHHHQAALLCATCTVRECGCCS